MERKTGFVRPMRSVWRRWVSSSWMNARGNGFLLADDRWRGARYRNPHPATENLAMGWLPGREGTCVPAGFWTGCQPRALRLGASGSLQGRMRRREPRSKFVTISDVARAAGVATSTVSRALTQPGRVSKDMRKRVESVATELGYSPNPQARSLTSGRDPEPGAADPGSDEPLFLRPYPRHAGGGENSRLSPHARRHGGVGRD